MGLASLSSADDKPSGEKIALADGKLTLVPPAAWERKEPSVRIIEHEFAIPAAEGDDNPGRLTIMGAGGSVEANIDRWIGQFEQPDGASSKDRTKVDKLTVDGQTVHLVDITGTYKDQRGPFAPAVMREDYRMLAAIIATEQSGRYFVKLYGPKKTIAANEKAFRAMVESLDVQ
ncbi:MAG: hypothetical protein KY475_10110 [Planctomycetes bacterium]|nr:hypothetical protein [Planctomycetota bacterium]